MFVSPEEINFREMTGKIVLYSIIVVHLFFVKVLGLYNTEMNIEQHKLLLYSNFS